MIKKPVVLVKKGNFLEFPQLRDIFFEIRLKEFFWEDKNEIKLSDFDSNTKGEFILTAYVENKIAGFISIWEEDNFIHNLFVLKEFRRLGVGKALLDKTIKCKGTPLTLKCMKDNINSVKFYLSQNWEIKKEVSSLNGNYYLMKYY